MTTRRARLIVATVATAALLPLMSGGMALASSTTGTSATSITAPFQGGPVHKGDPKRWGPQLVKLCSDPKAASMAGYNVVILDNNPNGYVGTAMADAIYALGGNDKIRGGAGDDVICLGDGDDYGIGDAGNDAVFGEDGNDTIYGAAGRDWLDGGLLNDRCNGGPASDAGANCEAVISIP